MDHPKMYLGDQGGKMIVDGAEGWYMSEDRYMRAAVDSFEQISQNIPNTCQLIARPP